MILFFVLPAKADTTQEKVIIKQSSEAKPVPYDFCGAQPWQKGSCGRGQAGVGYTVCEAYLKHINQSLPDLSVCEVPVPPKFKVPDWEEMDVHSNLHLAYEIETKIFSRYTWYKEIEFETWKKQFLEESETEQITPRMKKVRITPTSKGGAIILAYSRDIKGCEKGLRGVVPGKDSLNHWWTKSGYAHFILTKQDGLLEFQGQLPSLSTSRLEMLLYNGKPYFMNTPSYAVEKKPTEIYPRFRSVSAINNRRTKRDPSPDYLYTNELCQFMTIYNRIGEKRLEKEREKNRKTNNPEGKMP